MVTYVRCGELDYHTFTRKNIIIYSTRSHFHNTTPIFPPGTPSTQVWYPSTINLP